MHFKTTSAFNAIQSYCIQPARIFTLILEWLALSPHSKHVLVLYLLVDWDLSVLEFACSPCACVGFLQTPCFPPTAQKQIIQIRSTGYSNIPIGVNVSVNGCLLSVIAL